MRTYIQACVPHLMLYYEKCTKLFFTHIRCVYLFVYLIHSSGHMLDTYETFYKSSIEFYAREKKITLTEGKKLIFVTAEKKKLSMENSLRCFYYYERNSDFFLQLSQCQSVCVHVLTSN